MNYSETYFELDSEEATHCPHCHLISCVYIKGLVNTKDQSNAWMCEMMSKGSKEALTVLIVTHVTHVERVERLHYVHNIDTFNGMSKGSKEALTVLIVTHAIHVERVKRSHHAHIDTFNARDGIPKVTQCPHRHS